MDNNTILVQETQKQNETFNRLYGEIKNRAFVEAYLAVKDCITQKEFCKRLGINEGKFSLLLTKAETKLAA